MTLLEAMRFPNYLNSNIAVKIRARIKGIDQIIELTVSEIIYAAELAGLNQLYISDTGRGKSQLLKDISHHHYGGTAKNGNANLAMGRADFEIEDLLVRTQVDLSSGKYDSKDVRKIDLNRAHRAFFGADELNRAPRPRQNDFMDLATGERNFVGENIDLGVDGYSLFIACVNLNKNNGDFSGTFDMDRALLNRLAITIDLDHERYRPTPDDEIDMEERAANPKVKTPPPQDLTEQILEANKKIITDTVQLKPYLTAFRFLIGRGLDYCDKSKYKTKGPTFPILCTECNYSGKPICTRIKGSSERTISAVSRMSRAISYISKLKTGEQDLHIDPFDAALEAFRFTTYHGNLNELIILDEHEAQPQYMMDETITQLKAPINILRNYLPHILDGHEPTILSYNNPDGTPVKAQKTPKLIETLNECGINYQELSLKDQLKECGIGTDWVDPYVRRMKKRAKQ